MRQGGSEEKEKREGRVGGFEFSFPFGQKGRERGLRNSSLLCSSTMEGVLISPLRWSEGGGRRFRLGPESHIAMA